MGLYDKVKVGGGGSFLKLENDKMTRVRLLDYPFVSSQTFEGDGETSISTKFTWEVYDYESKTVKLLSKGASVFNQIRDIVELQGEDMPAPFDIGIKVTGSGLTTKYSVVSAPVKEELPEKLERIDIVKIIKNAIPLLEFSQGKQPPVETKNDNYATSTQELDTVDEMPADMPADFLDWPN